MRKILPNSVAFLGLFFIAGQSLAGSTTTCSGPASLLVPGTHSRSTLEPHEVPPDAPLPYALSPQEAVLRAAGLLVSKGYTEVSELGSGGMGAVVRAKDPQGNWKAIKFLLKREPNRIAAFDAEAKVMNYLAERDPRFLSAKRSAYETPDGYTLEAIEMPLVHAHSLDTLLKTGALSSPLLKEKIQNLLYGLVETAHRLGIWHLDLKPANILVDLSDPANPQATLIDFGLSYRGPPAGGEGAVYTRGGARVVAGTLGYLRPERLFGEPPSEKDDLYALRMVDWKLRAGTDDRDLVVVRNLEPKQLPNLSEAITGDALTGTRASAVVPKALVEGLEDESQFRESYKDPAFALDSKGTFAERVVAMAEWSLLPSTIAERNDLLSRAQFQKPQTFLPFFGKKIAKSAANFLQLPEVTTEILGSTVLIESLSAKEGLKLPKETLDRIAREAAKQFLQTRIYDGHPESLGVLGPHPRLHFALMKAKVEALKASGELALGWGEYVQAASHF